MNFRPSVKAVTVLFGCLVLAACAPPQPVVVQITATTVRPTDEPPGPRGELRYQSFHGGSPHGSWAISTYEAFEALYPNVNITYRPYSIYTRPVPMSAYNFAMTIGLNNPPQDVITGTIAGAWLDYVAQGAIADLSDLWEQNGWYEAFPQSVIDMVSVDGVPYFVPMAAQWNPVWYRADIFEEQGLSVPETWEDLLAVCDSLSAAGLIPFTVAVSDWNAPPARWFTILNLRLNGLDFHNQLARGQVVWTDERVLNVFLHWQEALTHNCFAEGVHRTTYGSAAQQIFNGEAVMYNLGEWLSESYTSGFPDTFDFFSFPTIDPAIPDYEIVHLYGAFMPADAENPDAALAFLDYLGSVETQTDQWQQLGRISANLGVDQSLYPDLYQRGLQFIVDAPGMVPLFEVSFLSGPMAQAGLDTFEDFLREPGEDAAFIIENYLQGLEEVRVEEYGELE